MEPEDQVRKYVGHPAADRARIDAEIMQGADTLSQCAGCNHKWPGGAKCWAFPRGIPEVILTNEVKHAIPRPDLGQRNRIVFEARGPEWPPTMSDVDDGSDPVA